MVTFFAFDLHDVEAWIKEQEGAKNARKVSRGEDTQSLEKAKLEKIKMETLL